MTPAEEEPVMHPVARRRLRSRWRDWRRSRPFWGGLLVILGGGEILLSVKAPLPVILHIGPQGLAGYLVPIILLSCGVLMWAHPPQRTFYAIVAIVLALTSWLTSNLGGFLVGMFLALTGGALTFAWSPTKRRPPRHASPPAEDPSRQPATPDDNDNDDDSADAGQRSVTREPAEQRRLDRPTARTLSAFDRSRDQVDRA